MDPMMQQIVEEDLFTAVEGSFLFFPSYNNNNNSDLEFDFSGILDVLKAGNYNTHKQRIGFNDNDSELNNNNISSFSTSFLISKNLTSNNFFFNFYLYNIYIYFYIHIYN
jgi:hypothetical protein